MILISKSLGHNEIISDLLKGPKTDEDARDQFREAIRTSHMWDNIEINCEDRFIRCTNHFDYMFGCFALRPKYHDALSEYDYRLVFDREAIENDSFKLLLDCTEDDLMVMKLSGNNLIESLLEQGYEKVEDGRRFY